MERGSGASSILALGRGGLDIMLFCCFWRLVESTQHCFSFSSVGGCLGRMSCPWVAVLCFVEATGRGPWGVEESGELLW